MVGQVAREQDAGARRLKRLALPIAMPEDRHVPSEKYDQRLDHERGELLERIVVLLAGAAGMLAFERDATTAAGGTHDFGTALWWTAMVLTTMGSDYFPLTGEGRALCLALALYGFTVFGYVTATLATFFVARDAEDDEGELAGQNAIDALRYEIAALRAEVRALGERPAGEQGRGGASS
jgi:hypothetical protein